MKELKYYIHLYLGCQVKTTGGNVARLVSTGLSGCIIVYPAGDQRGNFISTEAIKPILRKLEDMSEEEAIEDQKLSKFDHSKGWSFIESQANATKYLLSKGFDLFGLIDEKLAVNAKDLKV